jgi:large conductance mechanosensitive channel
MPEDFREGNIMKLLKEFKEFAVKGNVVDMGVGIVIGAAFTSVVNSLVKDVFTPLLGLALAGIDFTNWFITIKQGKHGGPYSSLAQAQADSAVTVNFGQFLNSIISFLIVAFVLFFLIRAINRLKQMAEPPAEEAPKKRECPYCFSVVPDQASRCPFCTSDISNK